MMVTKISGWNQRVRYFTQIQVSFTAGLADGGGFDFAVTDCAPRALSGSISGAGTFTALN
jgi:hypothetical protein